MVSAHPPFTTAEPQDPFYRCIAASRADIFWRTHCKSKENGEKFFSEEFKDIVQAMLQLDPAHRPSIPEVLAHPWMQGEVPSYDEVLAEFSERELRVKEAMEIERKAKEEEKAKKMDHRRQANMRSGANP
jgi:serine/threonine protein kinase